MSLFVQDEEPPVESTGSGSTPDVSIPVKFQEPEIVPVYPNREVNCTLPLKYQQEIVEDMLTKDGLLILGYGLGWDLITANLLHALSSPFITLGNQLQKRRGLIFVLNMREDEIIRLREELIGLSWLEDEQDDSFTVITGDSSSTKRREIYSDGGIISITSRVLVVDLLSGMIAPNDITGLFILHAERIRETSNDSFIINIYRDQNQWGFIKAFSDQPESFTGFTPLATKLKILRLSNVFLWPRFHVTISQSFNIRGKKLQDARKFVTEINIKLSYKMQKIQSAILSCIQACLGELKRHNGELATEYWDMANVHDPDFVRNIRGSLESQWHRLTFTTKQLVGDLSTLLELLRELLILDSISYYQIVQGIVDANIKHQRSGVNSSMSPWLNLDESNTIISFAKERALGKYNDEYILEELPKWNELGLLIDDILYEKSVSNLRDQGPILIMCTSKKIARQLSTLLETMKQEKASGKRVFTCRKYMIRKLHDYLAWKEFNSLASKINSEINAEEQAKTGTTEEEEDPEKLSTSKTFSRSGQPISKRRRTRGASATARVSRMYSTATESEAVDIDENILKDLEEQEDVNEEHDEDDDDDDEEVEVVKNPIDNDIEEIQFSVDHLEITHIDREDEIFIHAYNDRNGTSVLQEISPSHIIMYEPDLSFYRRVEIFQAINHENPAKIYLMYYGDSIEEQKHLERIRKEKEAFSKLIKEKASLSKHFETSDDNYKFQIQRNQVVNTRIAGGRFRTETDEMRVVVDVREFRSSLPNLLYRVGIKVVPCMITVGDYIVSPKICVERKSIPDLISSFKSGRLYTQCEQMFKHYELPTLLIEFDENKSFSLEPFSETRFQRVTTRNPTANNKIQQNIQAKLLLLLIAFPKLKIIWSSSPYETAQIFLELKANQEEPDVGLALDKGVNKSVITEDGGPPVFNDDPIDFIQNIPGINAQNYYMIIQKVKNIEQLVQLSKPQFEKLLGKENGRKAYNFINQKIA